MRLRSALSVATLVGFCAMIIVFVGYIASLGIRVSPPAQRTSLSLDVADVNNLVVNSNVLLRGVPIGKVTNIESSASKATIHLYIDARNQIPIDSDVRLENLSALGESYIAFEPRTADGPAFRDGQHIERVDQPPSVSELGASVVRVLDQLDPGALGRVVGEADRGLPDPAVVLPNLARTSLMLRNMTADFKGVGRALLDNFQTLFRNARFVGPALASTTPSLRDTGPILHAMWNDAFAPLTAELLPADAFQFSAFLQRIQKFLDDRGVDLRVLGEATSTNVKLIANALKNLDSSQILSNLLATVPPDGTIELHVPIRQN